MNKLPDLVDFCLTKSIPQDLAFSKSCFGLSSDHSPLITPTADALNQENEPILHNRHTKWDDFRCLVNERLSLNILLKTEEDFEAAVGFSMIQFNGQVGMQCRNIKRHSRQMTVL
jgi:hypothetical protein